ncbi:MAG: phage major capsid protein [Candidatus Margulisiibacteriota bacterium]
MTLKDVRDEIKGAVGPAVEEAIRKAIPVVDPVAEEAKAGAATKRIIEEVLKAIPLDAKGFPAVIRQQGDKRHFGEVLKAIKMNDSYLVDKYKMPLVNLEGDKMVNGDQKVITVGSSTSGGYMVPIEYETQIMSIAEEYAVVRQLATKVGMKYNTKNRPIVTAGIAAYWLDENAAGTPADWTLGQIQLVAKKMMCLTKVSNEDLEDSDPSAEATLIREFGIAIGNKEDSAFLYGAGSGTTDPITGIYNLASIVTVAAGANFSFDDVFEGIGQAKANKAKKIDLIYNPILEGKFRKLKGTDGQYLWANAAGATPNTIAGYQLHDDYNVPTTLGTGGTDTFLVGGDFSNAYIGDKRGIIIAQGLDSTDFSYDLTSFRAIKRTAFTVHAALQSRFFRVSGIKTA